MSGKRRVAIGSDSENFKTRFLWGVVSGLNKMAAAIRCFKTEDSVALIQIERNHQSEAIPAGA